MALYEKSAVDPRMKLKYRDPNNPSLPIQYATIAHWVAEGYFQAGIPVIVDSELTLNKEIKINIVEERAADFLKTIVDTDMERARLEHPSNESKPVDLRGYLIEFAKSHIESLSMLQSHLESPEST